MSNSKYLAIALVTASLVGGGASTVSLVDNATSAPGSTEDAPEVAAESVELVERAAEARAEAAEESGARPTDTRGYCVSQAVAAAHAAGKTGRDIAVAAHSCPKPNAAEKAARKAAKAAQKAAKAAAKPQATHSQGSAR